MRCFLAIFKMRKKTLRFAFSFGILIVARKSYTVKKREREGGKIMEDRAREARLEYMREWRRKNKDKVRENNRRYWERRAKRMAEKTESERPNSVE